MRFHIILALLLFTYPICASAKVFSHSIPSENMYPTVMPGDLIAASTYTKNEIIDRGDVVTYHPTPENKNNTYVGRVIGLPQEKVQLKDGTVYINGQPLTLVKINSLPDIECPEGITQENKCTFFREFLLNSDKSHIIIDLMDDGFGDNTKEFLVPDGHYFILGDNRDNSNDSRYNNGFVSKENIIAKVRTIYFSTNSGDHNERLQGFPSLK